MPRSSSDFDKLLGKATSHLLLEPDWACILQICDTIRQGDVQPKYAVAAIKKKLYSDNPHVAVLALQVMESVVKNCGSAIHDEIANRVFMEEVRELIKNCNENVRNKFVEILQAWAHAFRNEPKYRAVQDAVNIMKAEGYKFPVLKESDAMFSSQTAPDWEDGECCHRCRTQFTVVVRKHHCRACGQVFCGRCSGKFSNIPKFGIEKEVRVCEACYDLINNPIASSSPSTLKVERGEKDLPTEYVSSPLAQQSQVPQKKKEELQEEEELQLALALSQSEAESKEKEKLRATAALLGGQGPTLKTSPKKQEVKAECEPGMDPELARYLNRPYWEQKQEHTEDRRPAAAQPSAPAGTTTDGQKEPVKLHGQQQNGEKDDMEEFVATLRGQLEIFVNRMKSNSSRGRSIANDSSVQTLFMNITAMHSQLLKHIQHYDDQRVYYEGLQDKLTQIKDARAALDALREDHHERLRREAEEAERQRQIQMAQKLEIMRKKKQEYLEYQRQIALQRMQEQEREMHMRQEQQKQQYVPFVAPGPYSGPPPGGQPFIQQGSMHPSGARFGAPVEGPYPGGSNGMNLGYGPPQPVPPTQQPNIMLHPSQPNQGTMLPPGAPPAGAMLPPAGQPGPVNAPGINYQPYNMQGMTTNLPAALGPSQPLPPLAQGQPPGQEENKNSDQQSGELISFD